MIVPPRISHYSRPSGKGSYCLLFEIDGNGDSKVNSIKNALDNNISALALSEDTAFYVQRACQKLEASAINEAGHLIALIFSEVIASLSDFGATSENERIETKHISAIETYVNSNIGSRLTLTDVASNVFLSPRQVSRVVKKEYGCTLSELVKDKKLASAEMLIKNTDLSIGEIARQVNLGAENYFFTLFRARYGMPPLQYRRRSKK
ncbi:MAG: helix-turn-helix transcriptional regulator [Clostridia bacterium]|nr:helix-turn-helix transcriptional regulator [Clostridia bacterium]